MQHDSDHVPIRVVSEKTGVNAITLRAWERRYGLIKPIRTPKGHRLYSQSDIDTILQVLSFLDQGYSIGQVKPLLKDIPQVAAETNEGWQDEQAKLTRYFKQLDLKPAHHLLNELFSLYPNEVIEQKLVLPLIKSYLSKQETGALVALTQSILQRLQAMIFHHQEKIKHLTYCIIHSPNPITTLAAHFFMLSAAQKQQGALVVGQTQASLMDALTRLDTKKLVLYGDGLLTPTDYQVLSEQLPSQQLYILSDFELPDITTYPLYARHKIFENTDG